MKLRALTLVALLAPTAAFAWPWSTDMVNQPSLKPQELDEETGLVTGQMKPFPHRSVPVDGIPTKIANRDEAKELKSPVTVNEANLKKGKALFQIYCAACHGMTGKADSPVSPKIGAISLVDEYVQAQLTEGWLFGTVTFGSAIMPAYGVPQGNFQKRGSNDLNVEERWLVVSYVKNQLAKDAKAAEATTTASASKHK